MTLSAEQRRSMLILLVVSGVTISLCMGLRQSLGLFQRPMTLNIGVTASAFGFAIALQNIVWGLSQPIVGAFADRYGARPVLIVTGLTFVAGLLLMGAANGAVGLDAAGLLIGLGIAGTGFGVLIGVVTRATPLERRSKTVGIVAAAGSLGTIVIAPFGQALIDGFGWRAGLVGFAAIALFMTLLTLLVREKSLPAPVHAAPERSSIGEALRVAAKHRGFLAMTAAYFACGFQLVFIVTHLPQYLELCGVSPTLGATALGLIGLFNTVGTYMFGVLGARYSQKRLLAGIYLLRTLSIAAFLLLPVTPTSTLVFAAMMGMLWLGVAPLVTTIVSRIFGVTHFNMLFGLSFLSHQLGSFCGAWLGGLVFDLTGAYTWGWGALIAIGALAFALQWTMDDRPAPQTRAPRPAAAAA
jgi:predicted MFS family arabinose efflux permease